METLVALTLSGSVLALLLTALRYLILKNMPSTVYYYAWLLVLLRFLLPLPGLLPTVSDSVDPSSVPIPVNHTASVDDMRYQLPALQQTVPIYETSETEPEEAGTEITGIEPVMTGKASFSWRSPVLWLIIWGVGATVCFGVTVFSYLRFTNMLCRNLLKPEPFILAVYHSFPGHKPALYCCEALKTPLMCGIIHPKIILPAQHLEEEVLCNILRHELMHDRRRDTLYKWIAVFVLSLHWFNPVAWLARKEIDRACELSCDEMLLRSMNRAEKQSYGNTLLKIAARSSLPAGVVATTFSTEKKNLKERLEQIMHYKKSGTRILAAVLTLVLLAGCGMAAGPAEGKTAETGTPATPVDSSAVRVTNVDELLAAIAPNTVIELAAGEYDLSTASNYGADTHSSYYSWNGVYNNNGEAAELVIHNVDGLTLRGGGIEESTIAAVPRYASVIIFVGCRNLTVTELTAGHTTEPGFCSGGVLKLENCTDVSIDTCALYGCGTIGVQAQNCARLTVTNSNIYECSYGAVEVHQCQDVVVRGCDIHHHGTREGHGEAMNIFSVSYGEGFTVYNCRIHNNRSQYLLNSSFTRKALFLSNEIVGNVFGAKVFTFQQYGVTVDGCRFEGNDVSRGWYAGSGIYATDIEGNALEGAELAEMMLRDIPPERVIPKPADLARTTEVPVGGEVLDKTADEFLSCLGPDRTVVLDGDIFDLSSASNYGGIGTEYYYWKENPDGPELVIHDVNGLSIRAKNTESGATTLAAIPRFANVLSFRNCSNLFLGGFTAGHTKEPGVCSGGVLYFQNCDQVMIEKMRLYGCGILGIQTSNCSTMSVLRTEIYECSQGAGQFFQTDGLTFQDCDIHDVPSPAFRFTECDDKTWNGEPLSGLNGMYDVNADGTISPPMYEDGPLRDESEFHGGVEDLGNTFANEPVFTREAGSADVRFAVFVQKAIVDGDWEALTDKIAFPLQFFTDGVSFVIHDREEYLSMVREGYFTNQVFEEIYRFRQRIADADTSVFASCLYGNTCLDHLIAFARVDGEPKQDNLRINAISVVTALWPGQAYVQAVPPTPQP